MLWQFTGVAVPCPHWDHINSVGSENRKGYRQTSNISRTTLVGNEIVDHSDVVGASPAGAAPTTSSFSTWYLASMDWAKTTARHDEKHLSLRIWCNLYQRFYSKFENNWWWCLFSVCLLPQCSVWRMTLLCCIPWGVIAPSCYSAAVYDGDSCICGAASYIGPVVIKSALHISLQVFSQILSTNSA